MDSLANEILECSICGTEIDWEDGDDYCGNIWCCEKCGEYFCTHCFVEETDIEISDDDEYMDFTLCPSCLESLLKNALGNELFDMLMQNPTATLSTIYEVRNTLLDIEESKVRDYAARFAMEGYLDLGRAIWSAWDRLHKEEKETHG